jgi:hypothetical protein
MGGVAMAVQGVLSEVDAMTDRDAGVRVESLVRVGWLRATAPLWPLGLARILYGYLWWQQSAWKVPSDDFGRKSGGGLWYWFQQGIQHPTLTAYKDFQLNIVIPHWSFFGWMTLCTETFIAVTLILGLGTGWSPSWRSAWRPTSRSAS